MTRRLLGKSRQTILVDAVDHLFASLEESELFTEVGLSLLVCCDRATADCVSRNDRATTDCSDSSNGALRRSALTEYFRFVSSPSFDFERELT